MCKNSAGYNRTRNFGLYGHAESKKTQKFVFRSALRPNQISFSHDQDPMRTLGVPASGRPASRHRPRTDYGGRRACRRTCSPGWRPIAPPSSVALTMCWMAGPPRPFDRHPAGLENHQEGQRLQGIGRLLRRDYGVLGRRSVFRTSCFRSRRGNERCQRRHAGPWRRGF